MIECEDYVRSMYELKLIYDPEPNTLTLLESITYCATVELFLRGIHTVQMSATRIGFESERDRTLGLLILSESTSYTPVIVDKPLPQVGLAD